MNKDLNKFINKYLEYIKPYNVIFNKIWENSEPDLKFYKLDWNEATIPPSPKVIKKIQELANSAWFFNLYPSTYNAELMEKLSNYTNLPVENISYFASSDSAHEYVVKTFISYNKKVLIMSPSYDNFRLTARTTGAEIFYCDTDDDFKFNKVKFEETIQSVKPDFIYICSPNNPCGYVVENDYMEHLLSTYPDTMFLIDEAYCEFSGKTGKDLVLKYDNLLISRTMSKAFALANFRFGYLLSAPTNILSINKIRNPKNITTFAQEAAIAALDDIEYMQNYVREVISAREYFINELKKYADYLNPYPSEANFVLLRCKNITIKENLYNFLDENNIFVRKLVQHEKLNNCLRISIGTQEQMKFVIQKLDLFFGK